MLNDLNDFKDLKDFNDLRDLNDFKVLILIAVKVLQCGGNLLFLQ